MGTDRECAPHVSRVWHFHACSYNVLVYDRDMPEWTERRALIATVAYALRQQRSLLRRIVAEKHQPFDSVADPAEIAAQLIVDHLNRSNYELRRKSGSRAHRTP